MRGRGIFARSAFVAGGAISALAGCTSPNTYATARTVAPGSVTHSLAFEGVGYTGSQGTGALPVLPTYALRAGIVDRVDLGLRVGSLTELGADVKVNVLRGDFDVAIAPGAECFLEWEYNPAQTRRSGAQAYFHLPLILSYNVSKELSLVGVPGFTYVTGLPVSNDFVRTQVFGGGASVARLGVGIDYRYRKNRAIHPEITVLQSMSSSAAVVVFGVGFAFGGIPDYSDVGSSEPVLPPEPEPVPEPGPVPPRPPPPPRTRTRIRSRPRPPSATRAPPASGARSRGASSHPAGGTACGAVTRPRSPRSSSGRRASSARSPPARRPPSSSRRGAARSSPATT